MKHFVVLLLSVLSVAVACAQGMAESVGRQYNVAYLDIKAGLPKNHVNDIFADSFGFIWISTYGGGLVRYDGYRFERISGISVNSNACRSVCEDAFKRLWTAYDEGVGVTDLKTLRPVVPVCSHGDISKLIGRPAAGVYADALRRIWLVTRDSIFLLTFGGGGNVVDVVSCRYSSNTPDVVLRDVEGNGQMWANINGGLYRLEKRGNRLVRKEIAPAMRILGGLFVTDMLRRNADVWIATNAGLYRYDCRRKTLEAFKSSVVAGSLSHDFVSSLAIGDGGTLLVGTLGGVNIYRDCTRDFELWNASSPVNPLSSNFVNCIFTFHHQLWVGTENGGIVKLTPRRLLLNNFYHTPAPGSLSSNLVNAMYVEPAGRLWVGTVEGGLNRLDRGSNAFIHYNTHNSGLPHNTVSTLASGRAGRLWIGTWGGGVAYMDMARPDRIVPLAVDAAHRPLLNYIGALAYDARNDGLWIGSNDGLFFYDCKAGRLIEPFDGCRNVRGCIGSLIDSRGRLWMGCIYGVRVIDLKTRDRHDHFRARSLVYRLDAPSSKVIDHITSIFEASDGTIWLGSNSYGLYRRVTDKAGHERFEVLSTADGLPNNAVKGIAEDGAGRLWLTTDNGLVVYSHKSKTFTTYTEADGLRSSAFYWNSIVGTGGKLYLGSINGLTVMEGENRTAVYKGRLRFTGLVVDNQAILAGTRYLDEDISVAREIRLHESDKSFSIDFSALNFGSEDQGTYCYRMVGWEKNWVYLKPGEHAVRYSTLPPGNYRFEVRYTSALERAENQTVAINVTVKPYFYKSWWFVLLLLCLAIVVTVSFYNRRANQLRRLEAERLLDPIRKILEESEDPEQFRRRIHNILYNEVKYKDSYSKSVEADKEKVARKLGKPFIDRAVEILEQNYMNSDFGIEEFCKLIGMSRSLVNKHLNAEAGVPLGQFIRNYRLSMARELLANNKANRNITEIAYSVGFNDPKYFTRCFTKMYGVSPSAYVG